MHDGINDNKRPSTSLQSTEQAVDRKHRRTSPAKCNVEVHNSSLPVTSNSSSSTGRSFPLKDETLHQMDQKAYHLHGAFCADDIPYNDKAGKSCLILEIFAGSCRLSKACKDVGFRTTAVDKLQSRAENFAIYQCDLGDEHQLGLLKEYIAAESDSIVHAHFAPSCGTASKARERPIPGLARHLQPKPLRSEQFPGGLPLLNAKDRERVRLANISYDATVELVKFLIQLGISCSIENPTNSLFWLYHVVEETLRFFRGFFTRFDACTHGGARNKSTSFWSFNPRDPGVNMFQSLALSCDNSHKHAPWKPIMVDGRTHFPTSEEAAYPHVLCQRMAHIFKAEAIARGFVFPEDMANQLIHDTEVGKRQLFTNQSRQQHLRPLVSEFGLYTACFLDVAHSDELATMLTRFPRGSKVCSRRTLSGGLSRDELQQKYNNSVFAPSWKQGSITEVVQVGIPKEPEVFLADAVKAGHPRDMLARAPKVVTELLEGLVNDPSHLRLDRRAKFFKKWLKRSLELKESEAKLHDELPLHLRGLLAGKRMLLWKEILADLDYPDSSVVDDILVGFPVTGWAKKTGIFHTNVRKPDYNVDQLVKRSRGLNAAVVKSLEGEPWTEVDDRVWSETLHEVDKGWIAKPTPQPFEFVAKRFGLVQKQKVRMIDDFSICGVNGAFGLTEKLRVQSVDELSSYLALIMNNPGFSSNLKLVGRTYDLKSAYKQFGVDVFHASHCRVGVKQPGGGVAKFAIHALPFGATGSVAAFLRIAASISYIAIVGLEIILTNFFDDFTVVCEEGECKSVDFYLTGLFKLLGLEYAAEGDKAPPFSELFGSLGILFNLSCIHQGSFTLEHTERRKEELLGTLDELLHADVCNTKDLEKLHGRLVWFGSFVFGRQMNVSLRTLNKYAHGAGKRVMLNQELMDALVVVRRRLINAVPAKICKSISNTWLIFTDGAYEPHSDVAASVGGVLVDPMGNVVQFFGEAINKELLSEFEMDSQHPIYELEVLPVLLATMVWADLIQQSQVVFYIDNEAAKSAFIQGVDFTKVAKELTTKFDDLETRLGIISWFGRVASHSNLADGPSRLRFDSALLSGAVRKSLKLPQHISKLGDGFG